tara:strand:+ start:25396 stop:26040 length:645 start_codon:yes stop_codon:yes gene_type:complete
MSNLFNEIEEDLKKDKLKGLWNAYKNKLIAAVVIISGILVSSEAYKYWDTTRTENAGVLFMELIEQTEEDKFEEFENSFDQAQGKITKEYKDYALLLRADNYLSQGLVKQAEDIYSQLIDKTNKNFIKDLALLNLSYIKVDSFSFNEMELMLQPISSEDNPLYLFALEVLALSCYKNNLYEKGSEYIQIMFENKNITSGMYDRAQMMHKVFMTK